MEKEWLIILLVVLLIVLILVLFLFIFEYKHQKETIKSEFKHIENTFDNLYRNLNQSFHEDRKMNFNAFNNLGITLAKIEKSQSSLDIINNSISQLQKIFIDKKHRGQFGEIELYSILSADYGLSDKLYNKQYKLDNGTIVDCMIMGIGEYGHLPIDAKFPLENYLKMFDNTYNLEEKRYYQKKFKNDIFKHLNDIHNKYVLNEETCDYALMFLPSEAIYAEIYANHQDLVEKSFEEHVFFVSPSTLIAYISAYKNLHLHFKRTNEIKEIQKEIKSLSEDFVRFNYRYTNVVKEFDKTYNSLRDLNISAQKIMKHFEKINNVELKEENEYESRN